MIKAQKSDALLAAVRAGFNPAPIYTIGHSNHPLAKFLELLNFHEIQTLIDIRSVPYSRFNPQYNKDALARSLAATGITYRFSGDALGGRITDPTCYLAKVLPNRKTNIAELVDYHELIKRPWFQQGIQQLLQTSQESRTALLCSEENPAHCHRHHLIARRLTELEITVHHIRADGALEDPFFQFDLFHTDNPDFSE